MDPNPLHYQQADENEPLYRAAMLSALAVGIIIFLVLGIRFVITHSKPTSSPTVQRDYETSPDDTVNGMRHALSDETDTGPTTAGGFGAGPSGGSASGPMPSQSFATTTGQMGGTGGGAHLFGAVPIDWKTGASNSGYSATEPPSSSHVHGSAVRDVASVAPENLADLLTGR